MRNTHTFLRLTYMHLAMQTTPACVLGGKQTRAYHELQFAKHQQSVGWRGGSLRRCLAFNHTTSAQLNRATPTPTSGRRSSAGVKHRHFAFRAEAATTAMPTSAPLTPEVHFSSYSDHVETPLENQNNGQSAESEAREETMACWLFTLVGIGFLFPFSALTQPVDYWNMLFPDYNIEFAITSVFMYTNLAFLSFLVMCFGKPQYSGGVVGGFVGQLVVLIFVPTSYFIFTSENANRVAVLGGTAVAAIATAFIDSCAIALVSHCPQRVQECFQLGIGLSALIGSIYRDLTKLVFPSDQWRRPRARRRRVSIGAKLPKTRWWE